MKISDRISSLFCIGLGCFIIVESVRIGPGTLINPGAGLMPLGCGLVLGIGGLILLVKTLVSPTYGKKIAIWEPDTKWREMTLITISLIVYGLSMDIIGFYPVTILWMIFVCRWISKLKWQTTIVITVLTIALNYALISHFLGVRYPLGFIMERILYGN